MIALFIVTLVGTLAVQLWLRRTFTRWSDEPNASDLTGAETALAILHRNDLGDVRVESVPGNLTDHYDPRERVVRLSEANYHGRSVAGAAVAAHEVGHALQHARGYAPLAWRSSLAPVAGLGANFGPWIVILGAMVGALGMVQLGIALFGAAVLFQLVTLPVEFDASRRALVQLRGLGLATDADALGSRRVLDAAAMTYVAAAAASVGYLLYYLSAFAGAEE